MFAGVTAIREPDVLARLRAELPALVWINVTTAIAWISYFYSLKHLQPSVVNTLHSGAGPLTVIALAAFGIHIARPSEVRQGELVCYAGLAAALAFICWAVLAGPCRRAGGQCSRHGSRSAATDGERRRHHHLAAVVPAAERAAGSAPMR